MSEIKRPGITIGIGPKVDDEPRISITKEENTAEVAARRSLEIIILRGPEAGPRAKKQFEEALGKLSAAAGVDLSRQGALDRFVAGLKQEFVKNALQTKDPGLARTFKRYLREIFGLNTEKEILEFKNDLDVLEEKHKKQFDKTTSGVWSDFDSPHLKDSENKVKVFLELIKEAKRGDQKAQSSVREIVSLAKIVAKNNSNKNAKEALWKKYGLTAEMVIETFVTAMHLNPSGSDIEES